MKIGIVGLFDGRPDRTMRELREVARYAEDAGIDSMWFPEHVVFFPEYESKYPYAPDGNGRFGKRPGVYDPLFACTVAASATSKLRVGTAILIVPQRNPVVLAQEIVAVDHASDGRFDLGIGVGWSWEEFAALGVPWERRGARTDEYLDVMGALWSEANAEFAGEHVEFSNVIAEPKPVQTPRPPIWVGGGPGASMKRAAERGDGWYGWAIAAEDYAATSAQLDAVAESVGRDPSTLGRTFGCVLAGPASSLQANLDAGRSAGIDQLVIALGSGGELLRRRIDELAGLLA